MSLSTADKIQIGDVSTYLALSKQLKSGLFGARLDPRLPQMLAMETDAIRWQYDYDNNDSTLLGTSNYLMELCGGEGLKALAIITGGGGGTISPITPSGYVYTALSFIVTATPTTGQPTNGENTFQFNQFIGGIQFVYILAGGVTETVSEGQVSFDNVSGTMTRTNTFSTGETIIVPFLRLI
jgi:hypothetical protein